MIQIFQKLHTSAAIIALTILFSCQNQYPCPSYRSNHTSKVEQLEKEEGSSVQVIDVRKSKNGLIKKKKYKKMKNPRTQKFRTH